MLELSTLAKIIRLKLGVADDLPTDGGVCR
jgi:hypothetical protein